MKNYKGVLESLFKTEGELDLRAEIHADVSSLINCMQSFEFILLTTVWYKIQQAFNIQSKPRQGSKNIME